LRTALAVIVEELDQCRAAHGVADRRLIGRREKSAGLIGDDLLTRLGLGLLFLLVQRFHRLAQHLGVSDEIVLHDGADLVLLSGGEFIGASGADPGEGEGGRDGEGEKPFHVDLFRRAGSGGVQTIWTLLTRFNTARISPGQVAAWFKPSCVADHSPTKLARARCHQPDRFGRDGSASSAASVAPGASGSPSGCGSLASAGRS
jgi:hypothetical protein